MAGVVLRPPEPHDEDAQVALLVEALPWFGARVLRRWARDEATPTPHHLVAERHGRVVGVGLVQLPPYLNGIAKLVVAVDRDARGGGVGSRLAASARSALAGRTTIGSVRDDDPASLPVAEHWGFAVESHSLFCALDVRELPPPPPLPAGVTLHRLDSWFVPAQVGDAWVESDTSPEAEVWGPSRPEAMDGVFHDPVLLWLELDGVPVVTVGCNRTSDTDWVIVYTGTVPAARGRGLARLAKQHLAAIAAAEGVHRLSTGNEVHNTAIRALNTSLGYQPTVGEIRVMRSPAPPPTSLA